MQAKRAEEAKAAAAAAEAEALRLKAEKEAREFAEVFARKAKIFALEEQSKVDICASHMASRSQHASAAS